MKQIAGAFVFSIFLACLAAAGERLPQPAINPAGGEFPPHAAVRVSIRAQRGCRVLYTLDGAFPEWNTAIKSDSNLVFFDLPPGEVVVRAAAYKPGLPRSAVSEAVFTRKSGGRKKR